MFYVYMFYCKISIQAQKVLNDIIVFEIMLEIYMNYRINIKNVHTLLHEQRSFVSGHYWKSQIFYYIFTIIIY